MYHIKVNMFVYIGFSMFVCIHICNYKSIYVVCGKIATTTNLDVKTSKRVTINTLKKTQSTDLNITTHEKQNRLCPSDTLPQISISNLHSMETNYSIIFFEK